MKAVNNPRFGTLPDFGNVNRGDDHETVLRKLLPWAKGVSVKAGWTPEGTNPGWDLEKLIRICLDAGFHGFWGIESSYGRRRGQPGAAQENLTPDQLWGNEVKGIQLTKAAIERVVFKAA